MTDGANGLKVLLRVRTAPRCGDRRLRVSSQSLTVRNRALPRLRLDTPRGPAQVRMPPDPLRDTIASVDVASAMVSGARLTLRRPVPSLRPYVGCLWFVETTPATRLQTMPDACATLSIELSEGALPECFLAGPRLGAAERAPALGQAFLGVRLLPGVAFLLTGIAVHRLTERRTRLMTVLPDAAARLEDLLTDARTVEQRFDVLEAFLEQRLVGTHIDARVVRAVKAIEESAGLLRMAQLARDCQISPRQLHRLACNWVGIAPKRLATIVRFQAALKRMETAPPGDSQRIAADLGYFDQAHLTNESTRFARTSPARIIAHHVADFSKTRCG